MRKTLLIIGIIFAIIAAGLAADMYIIKGGWYRTEAVVEFIGLPPGNVYGSYIDESGLQHNEEYLFNTLFIQGHGTDAMELANSLYGDKVSVMISPKGEIYCCGHLRLRWMAYGVLSAAILLIYCILCVVTKCRHREEETA